MKVCQPGIQEMDMFLITWLMSYKGNHFLSDMHSYSPDPISKLWILNFQTTYISTSLLHFVAFFHVASLFSTGVDNEKVGVDNEKALELTNSTVFRRGRPWKNSRVGQQNNFSIFQPDFNIEISPLCNRMFCCIFGWYLYIEIRLKCENGILLP